jgi:hypothetical protein
MDASSGTQTAPTVVYGASASRASTAWSRRVQQPRIYVVVTPVTSIGQNEDGVSIAPALAANSVRAVDASGISDTYGAGITSAYTVSSATVGTLTASAASDNPVASQVAVSSSTTTGVKLPQLQPQGEEFKCYG